MSAFANSYSSIMIAMSVIAIICIIVYMFRSIKNKKFSRPTNQTLPRISSFATRPARPPPIVYTDPTSNPFAPPSYAHIGQDTRLNPQSTIVDIPLEVQSNTGTIAYPAMAANPISPGTGQAPEPYSTMELPYQSSLNAPRYTSLAEPITSVTSPHLSTDTTTESPSSAAETESTRQEQQQPNTAPPPYSENPAQATTTQSR